MTARVVTGGAGFIGANLCAHLAGQDRVDEEFGRVLDSISGFLEGTG